MSGDRKWREGAGDRGKVMCRSSNQAVRCCRTLGWMIPIKEPLRELPNTSSSSDALLPCMYLLQHTHRMSSRLRQRCKNNSNLLYACERNFGKGNEMIAIVSEIREYPLNKEGACSLHKQGKVASARRGYEICIYRAAYPLRPKESIQYLCMARFREQGGSPYSFGV